MASNTIILREKFSKASRKYDDISLIQKEVADELISRIKLSDSASSILDIGMGTGYLSQKLKLEYPDLNIYGLDLALGMLKKTEQKIPQALLVQADARYLPFKQAVFDLAISNLAYQWVYDLELALLRVKGILKEKGRFYFTVFSENTLSELRSIIFELFPSEFKLDKLHPIANLPSQYSMKELLRKINFKDVQIDIKIKKECYANLLELLNWLKMIGANRYWSDRLYGGLSARNFIDSLSKKYEQRFKYKGKIFATFEVMFVELVK